MSCSGTCPGNPVGLFRQAVLLPGSINVSVTICAQTSGPAEPEGSRCPRLIRSLPKRSWPRPKR